MSIYPVYTEHKDREARIKSATKAITAILDLDLYPAHKKELLSICIWKITEADGKHNIRYWTEGAISNPEFKLQHEHVYERKELILRLFEGEPIESVIENAVACMVTAQEHKMLTNSIYSGWQRYQKLEIRVFDAKEGKWLW